MPAPLPQQGGDPGRGKVEAVTDSLFLALKSWWMVTAALKLDDTCLLAGQL